MAFRSHSAVFLLFLILSHTFAIPSVSQPSLSTDSTHSTEISEKTEYNTVNSDGTASITKVGMDKSFNVTESFESLKNALETLKDGQSLNDVTESLENLVVLATKFILMDETQMTNQIRQLKSMSHFVLAKLHLSGVLPIFTPNPSPTSVFDTKDSSNYKIFDKYKKDWLIELVMAIEEDFATSTSFGNSAHYLPIDLIPLNLPMAIYHLTKASKLGDPSSQSLLSLLTQIATRPHSPNTKLPSPSTPLSSKESNSEKHKSISYNEINTEKKTNSDESMKKATDTTSGDSTQQPNNIDENGQHSDILTSEIDTVEDVNVYVSDWMMISHLFRDLGAGARSPSALLSEGYQSLYGIDTLSNQQCSNVRKSLKEAATPLFEMLSIHLPSPRVDFEASPATPVRLEESYTSQSLGSYKEESEYEKEDLIQYYRYHADTGDLAALKAVGTIHLFGAEGIPRDYLKAYQYLSTANQQSPSSQLAYMNQLGLGMNQPNPQKALEIYSRAALKNDSFALTQLGLLYLHGNSKVGIQSNSAKGMSYLQKAAANENPEALFRLGQVYQYGLRDVPIDGAKSLQYFIKAAQHGHPASLYQIASITAKCEDSVHFYRRILHNTLLRHVANRAYEFYETGFFDRSFVLYSLIGFMGLEAAQLNAAWLAEMNLVDPNFGMLKLQDLANIYPLITDRRGSQNPQLSISSFESADAIVEHFTSSPDSHDYQLLASSFTTLINRIRQVRNDDFISSHSSLLEEANQSYEEFEDQEATLDEVVSKRASDHVPWEHQRYAFEVYRLAAQQGSPEAHLKQGDFYYYGTGIKKNYNMSAQFYSVASSLKHAQAAFNLGYMYQRGQGVTRDFHLAKRYYDTAISLTSDAFIPATLALTTLAIEEFLMGGGELGILPWDNFLLLFLVILVMVTLFAKFRFT